VENQDTAVIIPSVQETIQFQEKPLVVVRLPNGQPGVVLRWMCENIHIDLKGQVQRIKRTESIADDLVYARIHTDGGPQVLATLALRAVPYWLATIDTRKMEKNDPRRRELLDYQRNAVDALYAWAASIKEIPISTHLVAAESISKPETPAQGAALEQWRTYFQQMTAFTDWQINVEEWRGGVEGRLDSLETVTGRILKQIGPQRITAEHQTLVQHYVSELSKVTNKSHQTIFASFKTRFRVPRYDETPESEWPSVVNWFRQQFPSNQLPHVQTSLFDSQEEL
jgi:antirepressor protein